MPATITDEFKRFLIDNVQDDFNNAGLDSDDPNRSVYYIGIGRTQPWEAPDSDTNPPTPTPSALEELNFRENLQSLKRCTDASHVTLRYNWTNGNIYAGWNNRFHSNNIFLAGQEFEHPFYVITNNNQVYVCIKQGVDDNGLPANSTVQPSNNSGEVFETTDGYQWKYMYTVGTVDTQKYLTSSYIPCETVLDSTEGGPGIDDLDAFKQEQLILQGEAIPGQIIGVEIENGGLNFPDGVYPLEFEGVNLTGEGITDAFAWATAIGGTIVDVSMKSPNTDDYFFGENYYNATVKFTGGAPGDDVLLRPIVSTEFGLGAKPDLDLNSTALMFNVILEGEGGGDFIVDNDFRQVGLLRNIQVRDSDGLGSVFNVTLNTDTALSLSSVTFNPFDIGASLDLDNIGGHNTMTGQTSGAVAIINAVRDGSFFYTQDKRTGYLSFLDGEPIDISDGGGSTSIISQSVTPIDKSTGDVFYIDYRRPFMRSLDQTEDIKIVIDF